MIEFTFKPLQKWPREQTPAHKRKNSPFKRSRGYAAEQGADRRMPVGATFVDLKKELKHLQAENPVVIEAGFRDDQIRFDGQPYANASQPSFPGILLSFRSKRLGPLQFACDDCTRWQDNLRAIALTLERLRLADLYGVTKRGEQYTGWKQLPGPIITPPTMTVEQAAKLIEQIVGGTPGLARKNIIEDAERFRVLYRAAAKAWHPDAGGSESRWIQLQQANDVLRQHHGVA